MSEEVTLERVQELVTRGPYHQWLGLKVIALHEDGVELSATWREEWVVNPERRYTHGGVLATLVDLGADWAMVRRTGRGVPTSICTSIITPRPCPAISPFAARSCEWEGNSPPPKRASSIRRATSSPAAAALISPPPRRNDLRQPRRSHSSRPRSGQGRNHRSRRRARCARIYYARLDTMLNAVARALTRRGLARGDRIAILSVNRAEYLASYFGIMRAGFIAVPVNFKFPRDTIHFILRDAGAKLIFCDEQRSSEAPDGLPRVLFGDGGPGGFDRFLEPGPFHAVEPRAREPAMFLYTSGSTGAPKGVVLSHQSHIWAVETRLAGGLDRHRYLIAAPLYHMNALALSKLACAAHATIVLLPQFTARAYTEAIARYRCTWLTAVPPMMAMMLRERELLAATDLSSVEFPHGSAPVGLIDDGDP